MHTKNPLSKGKNLETICIILLYTEKNNRRLDENRGVFCPFFRHFGERHAPADFVVIETGSDERAPIILGRPFLNTSGAVIYASAAKISFYIKGRKETFFFKNKTAQIPEQSRHEPRKRINRRNRNKQV